jgi:hypothetical protein
LKNTLESVVERRLYKLCRDLGLMCPKMVSPGESGWPDRIILLPDGTTWWVELKRPLNGRYSSLQVKKRKDLELAGHWVWWVKNKEEVNELIETIKLYLCHCSNS